MSKTYTDQLIVIDEGRLQKIQPNDELAIGGPLSVGGALDAASAEIAGDLSVGGNLTVDGTIVSKDQSNVLIQDAFLDLASGNVAATASAGGFTVNLKKATGFTALSTVSFAAASGLIPPRIVLASGGNTLAAGDIIQVSGAAEESNNGLFAVLGVESNTVGLEAVIPSYAKFLQNALVTSTDATAVVAKVDLAAFAFSDGTLEAADSTVFDAGTPCYAYSAPATLAGFDGTWKEFGGDVSLQDAYNAGSGIILSDATPLQVVKPLAGSSAIELQANAPSKFEVENGNLSLYTSISGALGLTSAEGMTLDAQNNVAITAIAGSVLVNGASGVGLEGAATSSFYVSSGALNLGTSLVNQASTSGDVALDAAAAMTLDAATGLAINSSAGAINVGNDPVAQNINVGTAGARTIGIGSPDAAEVVVAADLVSLNSDGSVEIDAANDSYFVVADAEFTLDTGTGSINIGLNSTGGVNIATSGVRSAVIIGGPDVAETYLDGAAVYVGNDSASPLVVVGNTTGASELQLLAGTGGITATGNVTLTGYLAASSYLKVGEVAFASFPAAATAGAGTLLWDTTPTAALRLSDGSTWKTVATLDAVTLQLAYDNGNSIEMETGRNLTVAPAAGETAGIVLQSNDLSKWEVTDANLELRTINTGFLYLESDQNIGLHASGNGNPGGEITLSSDNSDVAVVANSGKFDVSAQNVELDATGNSHFTVAGASLTVSASGANGNVDVTASEMLTLHGDTEITAYSSGGDVYIQNGVAGGDLHMGAGPRSVFLGNASTAEVEVTADLIDVNSDGAIELTAAAGKIALDATGAVEIDATANSYINVPGGELALYSSSALAINSGAAINIGSLEVEQPINIGATAVARDITIGNVTGSSSLDLMAGTGGVNVTGDVDVTGYLAASSYLKVGAFAGLASAAGAGALRWDTSTLQYSDGSAWQTVADLNDVTLQLAYDNDNSIELSAARNLTVAPAAGVTAAIQLDASDDSHFKVAGGTLAMGADQQVHLYAGTTSGNDLYIGQDPAGVNTYRVQMFAASRMDLNAGNFAFISAPDIRLSGTGSSTITIGSESATGDLKVGPLGARNILLGNASALKVQADAVLFDVNASGAVTVDGASVAVTSTAATTLKMGGTATNGLYVTNSSNQQVLKVESDLVQANGFLAVGPKAAVAGFSRPVGAGAYLDVQTGVTAGAVLYMASAGAAAASNVQSAPGSSNHEFYGIAVESNVSGATASKQVALSGVTMVQFDVGTANAVGAPVYMSANAGKATQTVPTSGRVFKIGVLHSTSGLANAYPVLLMPQFIADL